MKIGKYETNLQALKHRLHYHLHIGVGHKYPKPSLYWPATGWVTDKQEIINAIRLDDELGVETDKEESK